MWKACDCIFIKQMSSVGAFLHQFIVFNLICSMSSFDIGTDVILLIFDE